MDHWRAQTTPTSQDRANLRISLDRIHCCQHTCSHSCNLLAFRSTSIPIQIKLLIASVVARVGPVGAATGYVLPTKVANGKKSHMSIYFSFLHGKLLLHMMGTVWSNLVLKIGHRHCGCKCCVCDHLNLKWSQPRAFTYEKIM